MSATENESYQIAQFYNLHGYTMFYLLKQAPINCKNISENNFDIFETSFKIYDTKKLKQIICRVNKAEQQILLLQAKLRVKLLSTVPSGEKKNPPVSYN